MNIIKTFVKRPVTTTMVILIAIAFGILSFTNLQIDMMPSMDIPIAVVSTTYSGAAIPGKVIGSEVMCVPVKAKYSLEAPFGYRVGYN